MKQLLIAIMILSTTISAFSEEITLDEVNENKTTTIKDKTFIDEMNLKSDKLTSKIKITGGFLQDVFGYTDKRYKDTTDQGDYILTNGYFTGIEFYATDFSRISKRLEDTRFGMNLTVFHRGGVKQRSLYGVAAQSIDQEEVPVDSDSKLQSESFFDLGFFGGVVKKWYGLESGITVRLKFKNEKTREKYDTNNDVVSVEGRGLLLNDSDWWFNFYFRLGIETAPHYTISVARDGYDPRYGLVESKIHLPINNYFTMNIGGTHYKADSLSLEPILTISDFEIAVKGGTIIDYNNEEITKVGLLNSLYCNLSISYKW